MTNNILKIAKDYLGIVSNSGIRIEQAYLFGSHAKGNAKTYSDIDICIVSPDFGRDFVNESVNLYKLTWDLDSRIEPIPLSPEHLNDKYDTLASEIKKYGILLTD